MHDGKVIEPGPKILYANAAFAAITGYQAVDVLGQNCRFLQGVDTDPAVRATLSAAVQEGRAFEGEILNYRKDGTAFWNELLITPVRDVAGRLIRFIGIQRDITESEKRFRQTAAQLAKVLDSSLDAICAFDREGRFTQVSAACLPLWGYHAAELLNTPYIDKVLPDDQPKTREFAAEVTLQMSSQVGQGTVFTLLTPLEPFNYPQILSGEESLTGCR